jgi:hypothetical protein
MNRDPALNPREGDVVRSTITDPIMERHVTKRVGNDIWYQRIQGRKPVREGFCWISTWMEWCRKHKVSVPSHNGDAA